MESSKRYSKHSISLVMAVVAMLLFSSLALGALGDTSEPRKDISDIPDDTEEDVGSDLTLNPEDTDEFNDGEKSNWEHMKEEIDKATAESDAEVAGEAVEADDGDSMWNKFKDIFKPANDYNRPFDLQCDTAGCSSEWQDEFVADHESSCEWSDGKCNMDTGGSKYMIEENSDSTENNPSYYVYPLDSSGRPSNKPWLKENDFYGPCNMENGIGLCNDEKTDTNRYVPPQGGQYLGGDYDTESVFGEGFWATGYYMNTINNQLSQIHSWNSFGSMFGDEEDTDWLGIMDDEFTSNVLGGIDGWTSLLCKGEAENTGGGGEAAVAISTSGEAYAHVEGEKNTAVTEDGTSVFLYKVSFGAEAQEGCELKFNLYLDGVPLYNTGYYLSTEDGSSSVFEMFADWSTVSYSKVCMKFSGSPDCLAMSGSELCNVVTEADYGVIPGEIAIGVADGSAVGATTSGGYASPGDPREQSDI